MDSQQIIAFQREVYDHYRSHGRSFAWRETADPYKIWVSEIMLQQTQTHRVEPKYARFLEVLPTVHDLAGVQQPVLLELWQGLGYNRRALALKRAAEEIMERFNGKMPETVEELITLPGIGAYTAAAIAAFAFNQPVAFIETNIRRAYIHSFFLDREEVSDKELFPLIEATLDRENPRQWYYALMDYGSWLAKNFPNPNRRSKHYAKQSKFEGSLRQVRGGILRYLLKSPVSRLSDFARHLDKEPARVKEALDQLLQEGFLEELPDETYTLKP